MLILYNRATTLKMSNGNDSGPRNVILQTTNILQLKETYKNIRIMEKSESRLSIIFFRGLQKFLQSEINNPCSNT